MAFSTTGTHVLSTTGLVNTHVASHHGVLYYRPSQHTCDHIMFSTTGLVNNRPMAQHTRDHHIMAFSTTGLVNMHVITYGVLYYRPSQHARDHITQPSHM